MSSKNETRLAIAEDEARGFKEFKNWLSEKNTNVTAITPTKEGAHYDADVYTPANHSGVEIKYMPTKDYDNYDNVILNFLKVLDMPDGDKAADLFWIRFSDNTTVTMSRKDIDQYIKENGLNAFTVHKQYKTERDKSKGYTYQIQLNIPHTDENKTYKLYK